MNAYGRIIYDVSNSILTGEPQIRSSCYSASVLDGVKMASYLLGTLPRTTCGQQTWRGDVRTERCRAGRHESRMAVTCRKEAGVVAGSGLWDHARARVDGWGK